MRIVLSLPRHLHNDLLRATGLTASDYKVLMNLSEGADRTLRMADLAIATGLSASRTTRVVDDLQARGFVTRRTNSNDGRSNLAKLTAKGLTELKSAWPVHLASVRRRVFDHIDRSAVSRAAQTLSAVADALEKEDTGRA
ncbi:MAG: MarR family transcriptional regulator [Actinomycetota bacterium]